ncbi:hypothetical protein [Moritella sp. Urea-trap-13]|uniref:hypothetical protein n=1 Tax=Moritella sp. Urea-trap-13 TaxID=2058327 RepID=UPI000C332E06|nr:hypothetical protein [Moritella sp. Urea-trap-13]PKH07708.1 hypothetical protein CXF93_03180 [Moritella sp. Urea-trap-13]
METDKQELWFAELEQENNERLAQLEQAMLAEDQLNAIKKERARVKALAAAAFKAKHPRLSFLKRYNVIILMLLGLCITVGFNVAMFFG